MCRIGSIWESLTWIGGGQDRVELEKNPVLLIPGSGVIPYAVSTYNDFKNWRQYRNRYWPTLYVIDKKGTIQYTRIGEGAYEQTEETIQRLLAETA